MTLVVGMFGVRIACPRGANPIVALELNVLLFSRGFVRRRAISLATSLSVMATSFALAQDPGHEAGHPNSKGNAAGSETASSRSTEYLPSISDLMIGTIQPRHERIWRAGQDGNWEFAAYELGNLRGAFGRLGRAHPTEHDTSLPDMITSVTEQPFNNLNNAIRSKDAAAFVKAYGELTDACNSCHQALNHGVVKVGRPDDKSQSDLALHKAP